MMWTLVNQHCCTSHTFFDSSMLVHELNNQSCKKTQASNTFYSRTMVRFTFGIKTLNRLTFNARNLNRLTRNTIILIRLDCNAMTLNTQLAIYPNLPVILGLEQTYL